VPHPHDGVRPKAAFCARCRYRFGGVPITAGVIVCPECGHTNRFSLEPPFRPARRPLALRIVLYVALALFTALALLYWSV
jgi:hypothetical protein